MYGLEQIEVFKISKLHPVFFNQEIAGKGNSTWKDAQPKNRQKTNKLLAASNGNVIPVQGVGHEAHLTGWTEDEYWISQT